MMMSLLLPYLFAMDNNLEINEIRSTEDSWPKSLNNSIAANISSLPKMMSLLLPYVFAMENNLGDK